MTRSTIRATILGLTAALTMGAALTFGAAGAQAGNTLAQDFQTKVQRMTNAPGSTGMLAQTLLAQSPRIQQMGMADAPVGTSTAGAYTNNTMPGLPSTSASVPPVIQGFKGKTVYYTAQTGKGPITCYASEQNGANCVR